MASTPVYKFAYMYAAQPTSDGDEVSDDIDGHICIPSERILSFSLTDALLSICKSLPLGQTNQSTLSDDAGNEEDEENCC